MRFYKVIIGIVVFSFVTSLFVFTLNSKIILGSSNTLKVPLSQVIKSYDPAKVFNDDGLLFIQQSLDTLYQYHYLKRPYEIIPSIADGEPLVFDEGKIYRIKLKKDILYHPHPSIKEGRKVIAEDFINGIKRLAYAPLNSNGAWIFRGKLVGFDDFTEKTKNLDYTKLKDIPLEGVRALDDHTLEFYLEKRDENFLYFLAMPFTSPLPWELIEHEKNNLDKTLVGTGPYVFTEQKENIYYLKKFKNYRIEYYPNIGDRYANTHNLLKSSSDKLPFIENIEFHVFDSDEEIFNTFLDSELDFSPVPKKYLSEFLNNSNTFLEEIKKRKIKINHFSKITSRWLSFNMKDKVVGKDLNLRRAISYAIDREALIKNIYSNTNLLANSLINPSISGYDPSTILPYEYNLEKARKYLKKSKINIETMKPLEFATRGRDNDALNEARFFKESLEKLGLPVVLREMDFSEFLKLGRSGQLQIFVDNWIYDYPDAENILQLLYSKNHPGINKSGFDNKELDKLFLKFNSEANHNVRENYVYEIEKIVNEELPWIYLMYESSYMVHKNSLKNFRRSYFIRNYFKYLRFD